MQELEVRLQNAEADLKTAERRVDTLQEALKMQEEFGSGEEDEEGDMSRSYDDLSSSGGSYQIGELTGSADDLSDGHDTEYRLSSQLKGLGGGRSATPRVEDFTSPAHTSRRNRFHLDADDDDVKPYSRRKRGSIDEGDDDLLLSRRNRTKIPLSDEEEEEEEKKPRKSYLSKLSDEEEDMKSPTRRRNRRLDLGISDDEEDSTFKSKSSRLRGKLSPEEQEEEGLSRRRYNRTHISDDEEDEDLPSWKRGREKSRLQDDRLSPPADNDTGSYRRKKYQLSDEEEEKKPSRRSPSPLKTKVTATRINGNTEQTSLTNGTKTSSTSLAGEKGEEEEGGDGRARKGSISQNLVSKEQEQLYSVAQNRRRRRRTGDAKSTRQTPAAAAQKNGSAS